MPILTPTFSTAGCAGPGRREIHAATTASQTPAGAMNQKAGNGSHGTSTAATIDTAAIGEGAVTGDMIADGAVSLMITGVLSANAWTAEGGGYTQTITANGMLATDTKVIADINPGDKGTADILALTDEWSFVTGWTGNNQAAVGILLHGLLAPSRFSPGRPHCVSLWLGGSIIVFP